jgi:hypothetical protein
VGAIAVALVLTGAASGALAAPPASAARWTHSATPTGENSASYKDLGNELVMRCLGSALELVLYIDLPRVDPDVRGRQTAILALIVDGQIYSFQGRLIADNTTASIGIGGRGANDFAHFIADAKTTLSTSLLVQPPGPGSLHYNLMQYPVSGAAAAISAAYAGCGIPY